MKNTIKKPKIYLYVSLPSIFFWLFIQTLTILEAINYGILIIIPILFFTPFVLTFIYLSLLQLNWKIEVNKDNISYRNWLRKECLYKMDDMIVAHKLQKKGTVKFYLYCNDKKITTVTMYDTNMAIITEFKSQQIKKK